MEDETRKLMVSESLQHRERYMDMVLQAKYRKEGEKKVPMCRVDGFPILSAHLLSFL